MAKITSNSPSWPYTPEQLRQKTADQLYDLAGRLGLPPRKGDHDHKKLVEMIVARQELVAQLDRSVLTELAKWGHLRMFESVDMVELAAAVAKLRKMRFTGLSPEALRALAHLRGVTFAPNADDGTVINRLKGREGLRGLLARKRRRLMAKLVAGLIGESDEQADTDPQADQQKSSLTDHIEDRGLVGGLADKLRGAADDYVAVKLDEIERRIDRKLDDIDRRLAEWRDREIANRLRIIKITLIISVLVALISVIMAYLKKTYFE